MKTPSDSGADTVWPSIRCKNDIKRKHLPFAVTHQRHPLANNLKTPRIGLPDDSIVWLERPAAMITNQ
jgi:hypothetical protein